VELNDDQKQMLQGARGPFLAKWLRWLVEWGEAMSRNWDAASYRQASCRQQMQAASQFQHPASERCAGKTKDTDPFVDYSSSVDLRLRMWW
jgi:hypothetical protein